MPGITDATDLGQTLIDTIRKDVKDETNEFDSTYGLTFGKGSMLFDKRRWETEVDGYYADTLRHTRDDYIYGNQLIPMTNRLRQGSIGHSLSQKWRKNVGYYAGLMQSKKDSIKSGQVSFADGMKSLSKAKSLLVDNYVGWHSEVTSVNRSKGAPTGLPEPIEPEEF